jgi:hypothetical protein
MIDFTVLIRVRFYRMHSFKHSTTGFSVHGDIVCISQVIVYTRLSIQIQVSNTLWTSCERPVNALIFRSTYHHVHMELQLANMLQLTLSRSSQHTTNFGCIVILIPGFYGLFRYKILSLTQIFTLQSFKSNVVG